MSEYFDFTIFKTFIFQAGYAVLSISLGLVVCLIVAKSALYVSKSALDWYDKNLSNKEYPK